MENEITRKISLIEELDNSIHLIKLGFCEYQNLGTGNEFYYLPFQLISSGFERLMKCYICLGYFEKKGEFPKPTLFKNKLRHDLIKLKNHIIDNYFQGHLKALQDDLIFLKSDKDLDKLIRLLSEFGKFSRYYNLNVITGEVNSGIDVKALWRQHELIYIYENPHLLKKLSNRETQSEVFDIITKRIIAKLERFVRALSRQFTLGELGVLAKQYSTTVYDFLMLQDSNLGDVDYRKSKML